MNEYPMIHKETAIQRRLHLRPYGTLITTAEVIHFYYKYDCTTGNNYFVAAPIDIDMVSDQNK